MLGVNHNLIRDLYFFRPTKGSLSYEGENNLELTRLLECYNFTSTTSSTTNASFTLNASTSFTPWMARSMTDSVFHLWFVHSEDSIDYHDDGTPSELKVVEAFTSSIEVENLSAIGLHKLITNFIKQKELNVKKCRGQGYDGPAVMSEK